VVEGGNLGLTQRGRIEYAGIGGKVNSDFIDNSGGVNCSDREVNLKILLNLARQKRGIPKADCDDLLAEAANDVVDRILRDNFEQAQRLALEEHTSVNRMDSYEQLMVTLEEGGLLDRDLEGLPSSDEMADRSRSKVGLSRPELGVLLAYAKRQMVDELLASDLPDSPDLVDVLDGYFPQTASERFGDLIPEHPLRRELVATVVANDVVDCQGSTFVSQVVARTGAETADVVRSYRTAREMAGGVARRRSIEDLFGTVEPEVWTKIINANDRLLAILTRWFLRHPGVPVGGDINQWAEGFRVLEDAASSLGPPQWAAERELRMSQLEAAHVPPSLARQMALLPDLVHAPGILDLARENGRAVSEIGRVFFRIGQAVRLDSLERILAATSTADLWHRWARQTIEDDVLEVRRLLAAQVLAEGPDKPGDDAVDLFLASRAQSLKRVLRLTHSLESGPEQDMAFFMVVVRQVAALATPSHDQR
jgi:glutamate dehydrogenase